MWSPGIESSSLVLARMWFADCCLGPQNGNYHHISIIRFKSLCIVILTVIVRKSLAKLMELTMTWFACSTTAVDLTLIAQWNFHFPLRKKKKKKPEEKISAVWDPKSTHTHKTRLGLAWFHIDWSFPSGKNIQEFFLHSKRVWTMTESGRKPMIFWRCCPTTQ